MPAYTGHLAALGTSVLWSVTSILFTLSGRQVGSRVVNRTRLLFAVVLVSLMHLILRGQLVPLGAEPSRWAWLALSGAIGFVVGDSFLFQAFVLVGPRLAMLMMSLAPVFSTLMGWLLLHERLNPMELAGILLAVSGVALVVSDRQPPRPGPRTPPPDDDAGPPAQYGMGILFGLGAALGQAGGLITSKLGLVGDFPALSGTLMRLIAATLLIWLMTLAQRQARAGFKALKEHPKAVTAIAGGAFTGPFLGVWLSLIAVQRAPLGIASTLTSLMPIILLPIGRVLYDEQIGVRAIIGTVVAVGGTALLFLPPDMLTNLLS